MVVVDVCGGIAVGGGRDAGGTSDLASAMVLARREVHGCVPGQEERAVGEGSGM